MTILRLIKNNENPCRIAISALGFFEMKVASRREKTRIKKESNDPSRIKLKCMLHTQYLICFNVPVHKLKKTP